MSNIESEDRKRPAVSTGASPAAKKNRFGAGAGSKPEHLAESSYEARTMDVRCNDSVHRSIDCCPLMHTVMDTWPVQRLRDIKQLGTTYLVYPSGDHSRFEHSLGVAYLAQEMCKRLQSKYPAFGVTDKDVLCVTLAGLCHDLGHGPFSHLYEEFREEVNAELERDSAKRELYKKFPPVKPNWSHERSSLMMIDAVLRDLGLGIDLKEENLDEPLLQIENILAAESIRCFSGSLQADDAILTNRDWIFIKECVYGGPIPEVLEHFGKNERIGRTNPKVEWLYDIVSNRYNGIDVDKVDYFARDQQRTLNDNGKVDVSIINEARVALAACADSDCSRCREGTMHYQICYPKKCVTRIIDFFKTRGILHEFVYQHKTTCAASCMVIDILKMADPYYLIPTDDLEVSLPISRAFSNPGAFDHLRDSIIEDISRSSAPELQPAKELAIRFKRRILYKISSEKVLHVKTNKKHAALWKQAKKEPEQIIRAICACKPKHDDVETGLVTELTEDDVIIVCSSWHQGKKDKNPVTFVRFVEKGAQAQPSEIAKPIDVDDYLMFTSKEFQKNVIRAYCRNPAKRDILAHAFEDYWGRAVMGNAVLGSPASAVNFQTLNFGEGEESDASDYYSHDGGNSYPAQLTQDSEDEGDLCTPIRSPTKKGLPLASPSPVPVRRLA